MLVNITTAQVDSLNNLLLKSNVEIKSLQQALLQANNINTYQNSMLSNFGTIYTVVTIVIALGTIILPIWVILQVLSQQKTL